MIVVIADDLTGAGEIGGIGLAYGLKVELQREFYPDSNAELLIIDTDSRSFSHQAAQQVIRNVARQLIKSNLPIEWIYKKTDSVLRGPVGSELEALQDILGTARVLLVPANPSKGRIVRDGTYLINGTPLSETDFANDPEYPALTSNVLQFPALSGSNQVHLLTSDQPFPDRGIMVGQAETTDDLLRWSELMDKHTIMAGSGEFFEAILIIKGFLKRKVMDEKKIRLEHKALFVCGSSSDSSRQALRKAESLGLRVCRMPEELFGSGCSEGKFSRQWCNEIIAGFENNRSVIMAIDHEVVGNAEFARKLRCIMAKTVSAVFRNIPFNELFVEGGATASRIVECFEWNRFEPYNQLGPGVVRMKVLQSDATCLTVKPGSYPWPEQIRNLFFERDILC